jgi:hypothetical protein
MMVGHRIVTAGEPDEIHGHPPGALMEQLEKGVLTTGSRLPPDNGRGVVL